MSSLWAQSRPTATSGWQTELASRYARLNKQMIRVARQQKWPLLKNYSNHRQFRLQEIDPTGHPIYYSLHNAEAALGTRTQTLYAGGSLGESLSGNWGLLTGKLGLWDGGLVLSTHQELKGKIKQADKANLLSDHATHLAGTLVGTGINAAARGMAFGAGLSVWSYDDDLTEVATAAGGLLVSNHSYGPVTGWVYDDTRPGTDPNLKWEWWGNTTLSATEDYLFGFYTTKAADLDRIAYNNPYYLMVRSADNKHAETGPPDNTPYYLRNTDEKSAIPRQHNDAYDVIPAEATIKNGLTVGAADVVRSATGIPISLSVASYSGWGPTDDGRIKPDLLGIGTGVYSSLASGTATYGTYTGTSMASANVAGSLLLLQELYGRQHNGAFMRASMLKGLALHTADRARLETGLVQSNSAQTGSGIGPDYRQGWGLLNIEAAARTILNSDQNYLLLDKSLTQGEYFTQNIVAQGGEPLVVTICWTDPEGTSPIVAPASVDSRTPLLVHDLDLRVSDGKTMYQPWTLDPANPSLPAQPGDNIRDNIEQVYMANPAAGQAFTISVVHKGKLRYNSQPFSIVVSGLRRTVCQLAVSLTPSRDTALCNGSILLLRTATKADYTYSWLRNGFPIGGATTNDWPVSTAGQYAVRVTDSKGCIGTTPPVTVRLLTLDSIQVLPAARALTLPVGASVQLLVATTPNAGDPAYSYQWFRDGKPIATATTDRLTVREPGQYQVRVSQGACINWSAVRTITNPVTTTLVQGGGAVPVTPIDSLVAPVPSGKDLIVFPNPVVSTISVRYTHATATNLIVNIYDVKGALYQAAIPLNQQGHLFYADIQVGSLPPGHYFVQLANGPQEKVGRFVKQ